jgi:hypothetical protein
VEEAQVKIQNYRARAAQFFNNGKLLLKKGELEKAGEMFWGAISCYINAIQLLHTGKAYGDHKQMVNDAKKIATNVGDKNLLDAIEQAEKFHANFYHGFIPKDEFPKYYEKAVYAFVTFDRILQQELAKKGVTLEIARVEPSPVG